MTQSCFNKLKIEISYSSRVKLFSFHNYSLSKHFIATGKFDIIDLAKYTFA